MEIPKRLFMFWDDPTDSSARRVEAFVERWQWLNPDWTVSLLTAADTADLGPPPGLASLWVQARSDWTRLAILERHGGVYVDATTLALRPLDEWLDRSAMAPQGYQFVARSRLPEHPCMANWFIAARPGCPFVRLWKQKFEAALIVGLEPYCDALPAHIKAALQGWLPYLVPFAAWMEASDELGEPCIVHDPMAPDGPLTYTPAMAEVQSLAQRVALGVAEHLLPMRSRHEAKRVLEPADLEAMAKRASALPPFLKFPHASAFLREATCHTVTIRPADTVPASVVHTAPAGELEMRMEHLKSGGSALDARCQAAQPEIEMLLVFAAHVEPPQLVASLTAMLQMQPHLGCRIDGEGTTCCGDDHGVSFTLAHATGSVAALPADALRAAASHDFLPSAEQHRKALAVKLSLLDEGCVVGARVIGATDFDATWRRSFPAHAIVPPVRTARRSVARGGEALGVEGKGRARIELARSEGLVARAS